MRGVLRNYRGFVCGAFVQKLGAATAYHAEFYAVMLAVELAGSEGGISFGLEMDSAIALVIFLMLSISLTGKFASGGKIVGAYWWI